MKSGLAVADWSLPGCSAFVQPVGASSRGHRVRRRRRPVSGVPGLWLASIAAVQESADSSGGQAGRVRAARRLSLGRHSLLNRG